MRKLALFCVCEILLFLLVVFPHSNIAKGALDQSYTQNFFSNTMQRLKNGQPLTIVCIGSSSTQGYPGYGASKRSETYPSQLQIKLHKVFPKSKITVLNKGIAGNTIVQMLNRFPEDVYAQHPELVIWQTGTIEAIDGTNYNRYIKNLMTGINELKSRHYDVLLLDSQYYPGKGETPIYQQYVLGTNTVGKAMGLPVSQRYNYMVNLVETQQYSWNQLLYKDKKHPSALMHELTAQLIANQIKQSYKIRYHSSK